MLRNILPFIACFVLGMAIALPSDSHAKRQTIENEVWLAVLRYHSAVLNDDHAGIRAALADNVKLQTVFENSLLRKDELLDRITSVEGKLISIETANSRVDASGPEPTYESDQKQILETRYGHVLHRATYIYVFDSTNGAWKIRSIQQRL
jgi:hypothetical protein